MPARRRGSNLGRRTAGAIQRRNLRAQRTDVQIQQENEVVRVNMSQLRASQSQDDRAERNEERRLQQRQARRYVVEARRENDIRRQQVHRAFISHTFRRLAFEYEPDVTYFDHSKVAIGDMDHECANCKALKFKNEPAGMCCATGKVQLPVIESPPEPLKGLLNGTHPDSNMFLKSIRTFNSCFQMTSFGATEIVNNNAANGQQFNTTFKIKGQIYHKVGSLLPMPNEPHKFLQIYFMGGEDTESALANRVDARLKYNNLNSQFARRILGELDDLLNEHNELLKLFKSHMHKLESDNHAIIINPDKTPSGEHIRRFNAPVVDDVAGIMVGDRTAKREIVIRKRNNNLEFIADTHRSYDALQYPLMFYKGQDGYYIDIKQKDPATGVETNKKVSSKDFYAYHLMIRRGHDNVILRCRELCQQFMVDMYVKIENERLRYLRFNQKKLRAEEYIHLRDAIVNNADTAEIGNSVILPSTYIGSPRHMQEYIQDAMTYVREYGRPCLFITFTCNPKWPEITNLLLPGQNAIHRHDITARVFKQKLKSLMSFITKLHVFGPTRCWMYSVEWQKRGLPHAHILVWLIDKIRPEEIDSIISAEIPDRSTDHLLFDIVTTNMIHGPCGDLNRSSPCMADGKCIKSFPKNFNNETITNVDGYPLYRRRNTENGGQSFSKYVNRAEIDIDNRWVVPYSPLLCKTYNAHINVEFCSSVKSIKYICKYVNKGSDMAVFSIENTNATAPPVNNTDEITLYQIGRYISSNEAVWHIFGFQIHERDPAVIHLAVHLENGQRVFFTNETAIDRAMNPPKTTLTEFFLLCNRSDAIGAFARTLLYSEVPHYFTWNQTKTWIPRKQGTPVDGYPGLFKSNTLGRVFTVNPRQTECFYLRLLLVNVTGPLSFQDIRTINGQQCATYKDACLALGLLENDNQWDYMLTEAALNCTAIQIRLLFAIVLTTCFPARAETLWDYHKDSMTEDILHRHRTRYNDLTIQFSDAMYNEALIAIEDLCFVISNLPLSHFGMHSPNRCAHDLMNNEMNRELQYNTREMEAIVNHNVPLLNQEQRSIYDRIMTAVSAEQGGFFFLDAPGGTGKTFLISLILSKVRSTNGIALAVASSGIAATLLDGGRTAHSAFKLPLNIQNNPDAVCNIKKQSSMSTLLKHCKIIIWDECTMAHKHSLEALNRTLKDIKNNDKLFGGTLLLLSGDFRQTLPVIPRSTYADEINACLKSSKLWRNVEILHLKVNMRVLLLQDPSAENFSKQLLDIGNGKVDLHENTQFIKLPANFCTVVNSQIALIENIFPNIQTQYMNHEWLAERAILASKNVDVNDMNFNIQQLLPGDLVSYKSIDTVCDANEAVNYPSEFLNSLDLQGMPPHLLQLKVGSPVILLRNLNPPKLCNGTRLVIKRLMKNVVEATILNGKFKGEDVLLPRIPIIPTDVPIEFKRVQFPIKLAFSMTINKSQGQTLSVCGLDLATPCFSHGQLYVACSRVGKPSSLFVFAKDGLTKNIVHSIALRN